MNKFKKYCENTFIAECEGQHNKGDVIILTTRHGKEVECEVYNLLVQKNDKYYYSIVRVEDMSYAQRKAAKYNNSASRYHAKSNEWYQKSQEGRDFLSLGEPIKVGHHSEHRHRALINRNHERMGKSVEASKKAETMEHKAEYWEEKAKEINLSMPESLEFYTSALEEAIAHHKGLKDGSIERTHSYSLPYAKKAVNNLTRKVEIATKLWA